MLFKQLIQSPELTVQEPAAILKIVGSFNRVNIVFNPDEKNEKNLALLKTHPLGDMDTVYLGLKKHFKVESHFFIVENVPYKDLPSPAVQVGSKVGVMFLSKTARLGGYGSIVKQLEKALVNKGKRLAGKGALFISIPAPLVSVNRRRRFRLYPRVEDLYCDISGYQVNRSSPIPTFPVKNMSDFGASILMINVPPAHHPQVGDILHVRLSLYTFAKNYPVKRGVVISLDEIASGNVTQQQFVFKSKVIHLQKPNDRTLEVGVQFLQQAREGVTAQLKQLPMLTYLEIDQELGVEPVFSWCNYVQQMRRMEDKEKGI